MGPKTAGWDSLLQQATVCNLGPYRWKRNGFLGFPLGSCACCISVCRSQNGDFPRVLDTVEEDRSRRCQCHPQRGPFSWNTDTTPAATAHHADGHALIVSGRG